MAGVQLPGASEAGHPQPQTTTEPPGGPFLRHTQEGRRQLYDVRGQQFGGTITQPIPGVSGYYRKIRTTISTSGGVGTTTPAVLSADAPYNVVNTVNFTDPFGTPLILAPGWESLFAIPRFAGTFGVGATSPVNQLPSFAAADAGGNFSFKSALAFEFLKVYGLVSGANSALQPRLVWSLNSASSVYSTAPSPTAPTVNVSADADFYWLPESTNIEPPGLGTTQQWIYQPASPTIGSGSGSRVALPRLGGYLSVLILVLRDSTNARVDAFPATDSRLRMYVDGVPLVDTGPGELYDDMFIQYNGASRPTGTVVFDRKTSMNQQNLGFLDSGEEFMSTSPGTLVEIEGAPWGAITNSPATLNVVLGQIIVSGSLAQGLQEV